METAGIKIVINSDQKITYADRIYCFASDFDVSAADITYEIRTERFSLPGNAVAVHECEAYDLHADDDFFYYCFYLRDRLIKADIVVRRRRDSAAFFEMFVSPGYERWLYDGFLADEFMAIGDTLLFFDAVLLHASFVSWSGCGEKKGIIFSAPSGGGKSTAASLWEKHEGAQVINGDRTIIRRVGGKFEGFGSTFAGSSNIYKNESAPASAIVILRQSPENRAVRLEPAAAFKFIYSQTALNRGYAGFIPGMMDIVEDIAKNVPVFMLECRAEKDAVETLKKELVKL